MYISVGSVSVYIHSKGGWDRTGCRVLRLEQGCDEERVGYGNLIVGPVLEPVRYAHPSEKRQRGGVDLFGGLV